MSIISEMKRGIRGLTSSDNSVWPATIVLGLVIGITSSTYAFLHAVLLSPFPYPQAASLVVAWGAQEFDTRPGLQRSFVEQWRRQSRAVQSVGAFRLGAAKVAFGDGDIYVNATSIDSRVLATLGVVPLIGRGITEAGALHGGEIVLSYGLWRQYFGGDRDAVGGVVAVDGRVRTVVGVMPRDFFFPDLDTAVWIPITPSTADARDVQAVALLRSGADLSSATEELRRLAIESRSSQVPGVFALSDLVLRDYDTALWTLLSAGLLLLCAAIANTSNVLLARRIAGRREIAIRVALGASTRQIAAVLFREPVLVAVAATLVAIGTARGALLLIQWNELSDVPRLGDAVIDWRTVAFAVGLAVATAVATGVGSLTSEAFGGADVLNGASSTTPRPVVRIRCALLTVQIAAVVTLLAGAGLLASSFILRSTSHWGFEPDSLLLVEVDLSSLGGLDAVSGTIDSIEARLGQLPGVKSVATSDGVPIRWTRWGRVPLSVDGVVRTDIAPAEWIVSPSYFRTMGIRILEGREFLASTNDALGRYVVVGNSLARRLWGDSSAVGRRLGVMRAGTREGDLARPSSYVRSLLADALEPDGAAWEVIGVVDDVRMFGLAQAAPLAIYVHHRQATMRDSVRPFMSTLLRGVNVVMNVPNGPELMVPHVRSMLDADDLSIGVKAIEPFSDIVNRSVGGRGSSRLMWLVSLAVMGLSIVVAATGAFGITSFAVSSRMREFGLRRAVGANAPALAALVVRDVATWGGAGLIAGIGGALAVGATLRPFLFGVSPWDPRLLLTVAAVMILSAVAGALPSIRRAARLDPNRLLREI